MKVMAGAIVGADYRRVVINGKSYVVKPPTIHRLAGAAYWLSDVKVGDSVAELLRNLGHIGHLCKALSWFVTGDESLADELAEGKVDEIVEALDTAFMLVGTQDFIKLSALLRSARALTAKQNT